MESYVKLWKLYVERIAVIFLYFALIFTFKSFLNRNHFLMKKCYGEARSSKSQEAEIEQ